MTATITIGESELRDVLVDVGALQHYLEDTLGDDNSMDVGPIGRAGAIRFRLKEMLGLIEPDDAPVSPARDGELDALDDDLFAREMARSEAWQAEDEGAIYSLIGAKLARAIEASS